MSPIPALDYDRELFYERDIHPVTANTREDGHELLAGRVEVVCRAVTRAIHRVCCVAFGIEEGPFEPGTGA